jgi:hypothetical protein
MADWTRGQLWDKIVEQAQKNPKYYDMLMSDPRLLMEKQLGMSIPPNVNIKVVEETPDTYYIVLPYFAREGAELSDADLEKVAGGKGLPSPGDVIGGIGSALGGVAGGIGDALGGVAGGIGSALGGVAGGLGGAIGGLTGGGGAGGGGGSSCQASGNAVGTTVVDIAL